MPRLGDILLKARHLDESQLQTALQEQRRWGGRLGETLLRLNMVSELHLLEALSLQLGIPIADGDLLERPEPAAIKQLPYQTARQMRALPLKWREQGKALLVAMVEPQNLQLIDELRKVTGCRPVPQLVGARSFLRLLPHYYGVEAEEDAVQRGAPARTKTESSFKMIDHQGRTLVRQPPAAPEEVPEAVVLPEGDPAAAEVLARIEQAQRAEVATLRTMVELLIERGVFTREEYLARVKR